MNYFHSYRISNKLFYAKISGNSLQHPEKFTLPVNEKSESPAWLQLQHGTYLWPKSIDTDMNQAQMDDLFRDESGKYYKVTSLEPLILVPYNDKLR